MTAEVWTAQLRIVKGEASEESPEIAFAERYGSGNRRDRLYIVAEPARPGSERFIGEMVTRIGEEFLTTEGSLTGTMQRILRARHAELRDWNRRSLPKDRASYGLSCLLLREGASLLCQLGPSLAYTRHGSAIAQHAPHEKRAARALGIAEVANPEFQHVEFGTDGYALLISRAAQEIFSDVVRERLQEIPPDEVLAFLYPFLSTLPSVSALVVAPLPAVAYLTPPPGDVDAAAVPSQGGESRPDAKPIETEPVSSGTREMGEAVSSAPIAPPPGLEGGRAAADGISAERDDGPSSAPPGPGGSSETPVATSPMHADVLDTIAAGWRRILGWRPRIAGDDPWKAVEPETASRALQGRRRDTPKTETAAPPPLGDLLDGSAAAAGSSAADRIDPAALVPPPFEPAEFRLPDRSNESPSTPDGDDPLATAAPDGELADPSSNESPSQKDGSLPLSREEAGESADGISGESESIYGLGGRRESAARGHGSSQSDPRRPTESREEGVGGSALAPPPPLELDPVRAEDPPGGDDPPAHASLLDSGDAVAPPSQAVNPSRIPVFPLSLPPTAAVGSAVPCGRVPSPVLLRRWRNRPSPRRWPSRWWAKFPGLKERIRLNPPSSCSSQRSPRSQRLGLRTPSVRCPMFCHLKSETSTLPLLRTRCLGCAASSPTCAPAAALTDRKLAAGAPGGRTGRPSF